MKIPKELANERFDKAVQKMLEARGKQVSVREVRFGIRAEQITLDSRYVKPGMRVAEGQDVGLQNFVLRSEARLLPEPELLARVQVLHEDEALLILNKPSGVPTALRRPSDTGTLIGAAIAHCPEIADAGPALEGGLVHRLDNETSGVVVFAKDKGTRQWLRDAFSKHRIRKRYDALVWGSLPERSLRLEDCILDAARHRVRVFDKDEGKGRYALTDVQTLKLCEGGFTWVKATTLYGRRHQIRAQLSASGFPILSDPLYGKNWEAPVNRLALHASEVTLADGRSFSAPLPEDMEVLIR